MNRGEIVSVIWGVADLIRDTFKRGKYQDVILPLTVLRRLDCVLAPTKVKVLKRQAELRGKGLQDFDAQLRRASGFAFYNTSRYDFEKLLADAPHVAANLRNYIAGFSPNMREVLDPKDGQVGLVGYEINFNRYFHRYKPPRPLEEIEAEICDTERDIVRMLTEVCRARTVMRTYLEALSPHYDRARVANGRGEDHAGRH